MIEPGRRFALASDLRLHVFAVVFALGTIHHELGFVLEEGEVGPLTEYMERWSRAVPSTGWPSELALALHAVIVAIALLLLWRRWPRELLCLLAVTFFLSQLASPHRISSHAGLMAGGLLVILVFGMAEWIDRLRRGTGAAAWHAGTLTGLSFICALTYFFAFLYKLNPVWLSPGRSTAPAFLIRPVMPILRVLGLGAAGRPILEAMAIHGTLLVELFLPVLLIWPPTRVLGCLVGLVFHLPMVAQGVSDFPVLIVALYPAFLSLAETRELVDRVLGRPSVARLVGTAVLGGYGALVIQRAPALSELYGGAWLHPVVRIGHNVLTCATLLAFVYVALGVAGWLLERTPSESRLPARSRSTSMAVIAGVVCVVVFAYLNLARFVGLPAAGAMTMYSGISSDLSNHLLVPRLAPGDGRSYTSIVKFESPGIDTLEAREFRAFRDWLARRGRPTEVSANFLHYHVRRICASAPGGALQLALRTASGETWSVANACAEPAMSRYWPIPLGPACKPDCTAALQLWARGVPLSP
jgi:hypothetical protein